MTQNIELIIKNPSSSSLDFKIQANLSDTIEQLKYQLFEKYPSNPRIEQQKLIFAGRLLKNESLLSEVLNQYDTTTSHTFHIVISKLTSSASSTSSNHNGYQQPNFDQHVPQMAFAQFPPQNQFNPHMNFQPNVNVNINANIKLTTMDDFLPQLDTSIFSHCFSDWRRWSIYSHMHPELESFELSSYHSALSLSSFIRWDI